MTKKIYFAILVVLVLALGAFAISKMHSTSEKNMAVASNLAKNSGKVTFIELGSESCIPCKAMAVVMAKIDKKLGDQVNTIFYDVWKKENKKYGRAYKIKVIPTQVFLDKNGKEYFRHEGYFPAEKVYDVLERAGVKIYE